MAQRHDDPWRLPALEAFGSQLGGLEGESQPAPRRSGPRRALVAAACAAVLAVIAAAFVLRPTTPASASSAVNRAPSLAARSMSVMFRSQMEVFTAGRPVRDITERGALDFASGAYLSVFRLAAGGEAQERRRVGAVLYLRLSPKSAGRGARWVATRLSPAEQADSTPAPGPDSFTDPFALLRVLALTDAPAVPAGGARIDGIATRRYVLSSNLASVRRSSSGIANQPPAFAHVHVDIEVWLDRQGRPRKVSEDFYGGSAAPGSSLRTATTFSGYGLPVRISPPDGVRVSAAPADGGPTASSPDPVDLYERLLFGGG